MNKDIRISTSVVANTATTRNAVDPDCDAMLQMVEMLRTNGEFKETLLQYGCTSNDILFVVNHEVFIRNNGSNVLQRLVVERQDLYQSVDTRNETRKEIISDIFRVLVTENKGRFMCLIMKNEQNICEPMMNEEIIKILHMCLSSSMTDKDDTCQPKRLDDEKLYMTNIDHQKSQGTSTANSDALMLNQENYDIPSFSPDRVVKSPKQSVNGVCTKGTTLLSPCSVNSKRVYRGHSGIAALTRECDDMMPGIPPFPCDLETLDYKNECQDVIVLHENSHEITCDKENNDSRIEGRYTRSTLLQHSLRNSLLFRDNGVRHLEHSDIIDASPESWRYNSALLRNSKGPGLRRLDTIICDEETNFHENHVENIYHEVNDIDRNQQLMNMPIGSVSTISSCGVLSDFSCTGIFSASSSQHTMMSISSRNTIVTITEQQQRQEGACCTMTVDPNKNIQTKEADLIIENESISKELSSSVVGELDNFMSRVFRHRDNSNIATSSDEGGSTTRSFSLLSSINRKKKHIQKSIVEARKSTVE